jgi:hypothetical protein
VALSSTREELSEQQPQARQEKWEGARGHTDEDDALLLLGGAAHAAHELVEERVVGHILELGCGGHGEGREGGGRRDEEWGALESKGKGSLEGGERVAVWRGGQGVQGNLWGGGGTMLLALVGWGCCVKWSVKASRSSTPPTALF